jgi:DNA polymerase Ligase (LigD)
MLIWDTGEYSVLPYRGSSIDSDAESGGNEARNATVTDSEKLRQAFRQRKIRLRLHGTRLPQGYTLAIRADKHHFPTEQPRKPARTRRRKAPKSTHGQKRETPSSEGSDTDQPQLGRGRIESLHRPASPPRTVEISNENVHAASEEESETIRLANAYPGATNDINSVHQRKWYLSMDRNSSGFYPVRDNRTGLRTWTRKTGPGGMLYGFEKFWVMGRDVERSVITGRLAKDIMEDEGVEGYVPRGLWRPVTE